MNLTIDMIIEGLRYTELMLIWNSVVDCVGICMRITLFIVSLSESFFWFIWNSAYFAYDKRVINLMPGLKVSFWGSVRGKFSVNIKMNDFDRNILQSKFYACWYILLSGTCPRRRCTHTYLGHGQARNQGGHLPPPPEIIKTLHSDVDIFAETFKE